MKSPVQFGGVTDTLLAGARGSTGTGASGFPQMASFEAAVACAWGPPARFPRREDTAHL